MSRVAFLTWGNGSQLRSFHDYASLLDDLIYLPELPEHDLSRYAAIVAPDAMNPPDLARHARALNDYVRSGGCLVIFGGSGVEEWIDVVDLTWKPIYTKDWLWWTKPGQKLEIYQPEPRHPICETIPLRDMGWHWFGVFALHDQAHSALNLDDDAGSLLLDFNRLPNGGRLIVSTLDPHTHNGERFMPATTRFLDGFYPWLNRELGIRRGQTEFTLTYAQCFDHPTEWRPPELDVSLKGTEGRVNYMPLEHVCDKALADADILYIPNNQDQFYLRKMQERLIAFLARGGHLIVNSEPAISWLPFIKPFEAVASRPFTNLKVRVRDDPFGMFQNMEPGFDSWEGIHGQYARGWTPMPEGAIWLTEVGSPDDPKPADWLWKYPTDDGKGGYVFMHNGDNMIRYPDRGPHTACLVRDVCRGLMRASRNPPRC